MINKVNRVSLVVIGIFAVAFAMYLITIPIYRIAHELSVLNHNFSNLGQVEKELKELGDEFDKFNAKVDDSTLLSI